MRTGGGARVQEGSAARKGVEAVAGLALGCKGVRVQQGREPGAEVRTQLEAGVGAGAVTGFTQCCTCSMC